MSDDCSERRMPQPDKKKSTRSKRNTRPVNPEPPAKRTVLFLCRRLADWGKRELVMIHDLYYVLPKSQVVFQEFRDRSAVKMPMWLANSRKLRWPKGAGR